MSEENKESAAAPEAQTGEPAKAPEAPKIDMDAIRQQAVEEARKAIQADKAKIQKEVAADLAKRLTGEEDKPEVNPLVKAFLTDPENFVSAQHESIIEHVTRQIEEKNAKAHADEKVLAELSKEYPELVGEHLDYLDLEFTKLDKKDPSAPRKEKIEQAAKNIAKRLKLKPLSERTSDDEYISAAFPGSGGASWGGGDSAKSPHKSALDFIESRKEAARAMRSRKLSK